MTDAAQTVSVELYQLVVLCVSIGFLGGLLAGLIYHLFNQEIIVENVDDDDDDGGDVPIVPDVPVSRPSRKPRFPVNVDN